jgi:acyl-CoA thioesterase
MENLTEYAREQVKACKGFIEANNYEVIKVEPNYCELEGIITNTSTNHLNIVHGGYIFGLADTAAGIAAMTDGRNAVTINSSIIYLKPSKGNKLKAIAKCIKNGKNVAFFEVSVYDDNDVLTSIANIIYNYI